MVNFHRYLRIAVNNCYISYTVMLFIDFLFG